MSDISILSHEYKEASELSQAVSRAVISVKKVHQGLPGAEKITPKQLGDSRNYLANILDALFYLLDPNMANGSALASATGQIPGALVARLHSERRGDLPYYLEDLKRVSTRLRQGASNLTDEDLSLLDHIAALADVQTSSVFRRLMRG